MTPVQEVDVHTSKKVLYKGRLIQPYGSATYHAEIDLHDSEFQWPFSSRVSFHESFPDVQSAYERMLAWINGHSKVHTYPLEYVNNPCNCEFIKQPDQEAIVHKLGLSVPVRVNGA